MTYTAMTDLAHGQLVTEAHMDTIRQNIEHLASMVGGGSALSALASGSTLNAPDYDSGWFSVAYNNNYVKAHGQGVTPRHVEAWHSAVASPGSGDELVRITVVYHSTSIGSPLSADATNIAFKAGNDASQGVVSSVARNSGGGYVRLVGWK